tara:strand:- start:2463 stop:3503 length:1041 start_codon:yes stop_codon:yes gene_type:complete
LHPSLNGEALYRSNELINEIENLTNNLGIFISAKRIIKIKKINPSSMIGKGIINEIRENVVLNKINLLIVNSILSPRQQKNLEDKLKIKVIDRTGIIIEIFSKRAKSKEGKLQVELADLIYRKSRLVRAWTHLERQRGGTTFIGGPGELQIELDRRLIQEKITKIKSILKKVKKRRNQQRKLRKKRNFKTFALVGYTNAGKSQLFNCLTKKKQSSKNVMFETLDTKTGRVYLGKNNYIGVIDTVGFINNIPTQLIESFKATLEELTYADVLINVIDISDIDYKSKEQVTIETLRMANVCESKIDKMITVYNKVDLSPYPVKSERQNFISAYTGDGIEAFKSSLIHY